MKVHVPEKRESFFFRELLFAALILIFVSEAAAQITLTDEARPLSLECGPDNHMAYSAWLQNNGGAVAITFDPCMEDIEWSNDAPDFIPGCKSFDVTFTARACGVSVSTTVSFSITDNVAPLISIQAQDQTVACDGSGNQALLDAWLDNKGGAVAMDACGEVSWNNNFSGLTSGCGTTGSATVIFTATDACGNTATTTATFSITDDAAPVILTPAQELFIACDSPESSTALAQWLNSNAGAMASDACGIVSWTHNFSALTGCGATGSTEVVFTASDACGNTATTSAMVTKTDNIPPQIIGTLSLINITGCSDLSLPAAYTTVAELESQGLTISDYCTPKNELVVDYMDEQISTCPLEFRRTYTISDACGNSSSVSGIFRINPPAIVINAPASLEVENPVSEEQFYQWLNSATFSGGCNATMNVDYSAPGLCSGSVSATWTVTGNCGQTLSATRTFSVKRTYFQTVSAGEWNDPAVWQFNCIPSHTGGLNNKTKINILHNVNLAGASFLSGQNTNLLEIFIGGPGISCTLSIDHDFIIERTVNLQVFPGSFLQIGKEPEEYDFCTGEPDTYRKSIFVIKGSNLSPHLQINAGAGFLLYGDFVVENNFRITVDPGGEFEVRGSFEANNSAVIDFKASSASVGCDMVFKNGGTINMYDSSILSVGGELCSSPGGGSAVLNIIGDISEPPNTVVYGRLCANQNINFNNVDPLPIELLSFSFEIHPGVVLLRWITATEINNDFFTIERSRDMLQWEELGKIQGAGNSNELLSYNFSDRNPVRGISYYRLKQTDFDGKFEYFAPVAVNMLSVQDLDFRVTKYPEQWMVILPEEGIFQVEVFSLLGRKLSSGQATGQFLLPAPGQAVVIRVFSGNRAPVSRIVL